MSEHLHKISKYMQSLSQYQATITDASYPDYTTELFHEKNTGYIKRAGQKFHNYLLGIHTIQNGTCRLVIDTAKKVLVVADPLESINDVLSDTVYNYFMKVCSKIRIAHTGNQTYYRLEFKDPYPLSFYTMTIKDSLVEKIVMYYRNEVKVNNRSGKPRLEMTFDKWKTSIDDTQKAFDINNYVFRKGREYCLTASYKGKYKLLDERVKTRNLKE